MESIWFLLAILSSFVQSLKEISIKNNLKGIDSNALIFILSFLSIIFWFPFIIYNWIPELSLKFWWVFFLSWILFYIWKLFSFKAFQVGDISTISPLKSLITVFSLFLWILIVWDKPSFLWLIWIIVIVVWVYFLNLQKYHTKIYDPIMHLFKNKWSKYFLVSIICYSFTFVFDKVWVLESNPIFWVFMMNFFLFFTSFNNFKKDYFKNKTFLITKYKFLFLTFFFYALSHITQMTALQFILLQYVSAIKTSSLLFAIVIWWLFFKEKWLKRKFLIWLIIVSWVILIYFW